MFCVEEVVCQVAVLAEDELGLAASSKPDIFDELRLFGVQLKPLFYFGIE